MSTHKKNLFYGNQFPNKVFCCCRLVGSLAILVFLAAVTAVLWAQLKPFSRYGALPEGLEWVSPEGALRLSAAVWVDARLEEEYARGHVPGALNLRPGHWEEDFPKLVERWRPGRAVVVYCDEGCNLAAELGERLRKAVPAMNIKILKGGFEAWRSN